MQIDHEHPRPGSDYPRDLLEFHRLLPDEEACLRYLERLRWPRGFGCPSCGAQGQGKRWSRGRLICSQCRHETSVTAGTIFEGTRKPLQQWFLACWEVTSRKSGANALGLQRALGLRSYETAWAWLHKLRRAMVRPGRDRLKGKVEVDETYIGAPEKGVRGRKTARKALVAIAVELNNQKIGRIRLRHIPDASAKSLTGFVNDVAEPGSVIRTDGFVAYKRLSTQGFKREVVVLSDYPDPAHVTMPSVHRVASLLKRWWLGTLHGGISDEHLRYYLDEFTFRFNRRSSGSRGLLFFRLLSQAVETPHTLTDDLFQGVHAARRAASGKRRRRRRSPVRDH